MNKRSLLLVGALVCGALIYSGFRAFPLLMLDGASAELFLLWLDDPTQYSNGYSHSKFRSVDIGMTESEVKALLGDPMSERNSTSPRVPWDTCWSYSNAGPHVSETGRARDIFLRGGVVVEIGTGPWLD